MATYNPLTAPDGKFSGLKMFRAVCLCMHTYTPVNSIFDGLQQIYF